MDPAATDLPVVSLSHGSLPHYGSAGIFISAALILQPFTLGISSARCVELRTGRIPALHAGQ
ncbi:hypothetical protein DL93DRAFT_2091552 [Clavulina sp. PMI_390]|nr:hypothetical protein DL93DRAFT_2091552 [Clavulina sp. PMI_390]